MGWKSLKDRFYSRLLKLDKPLVFPEIPNHGGVVIPTESYGIGIRERIRKLAMQARNESINFVFK